MCGREIVGVELEYTTELGLFLVEYADMGEDKQSAENRKHTLFGVF